MSSWNTSTSSATPMAKSQNNKSSSSLVFREARDLSLLSLESKINLCSITSFTMYPKSSWGPISMHVPSRMTLASRPRSNARDLPASWTRPSRNRTGTIHNSTMAKKMRPFGWHSYLEVEKAGNNDATERQRKERAEREIALGFWQDPFWRKRVFRPASLRTRLVAEETEAWTMVSVPRR